MKQTFQTIIFDFDGVILDSMHVRDFGFAEIFKAFPKEQVDKLVAYHQYNAGLSRFHKIRYFYEEILGQAITEDEVQAYADTFSKIMKQQLTDKNNLITEWVEFIVENHQKYDMYVASGSEQNELRFLCQELGLSQYFKGIFGSPIHKNQLVASIIADNNCDVSQTVMIGDSINDYEAAHVNKIHFYGYNNIELKNAGYDYLDTVVEF